MRPRDREDRRTPHAPRSAVLRNQTMSTASSNPGRDAENARWHALEERRDALRAVGLRFSGRQYGQIREAHAAGRLIDELNRAMEGRATAPPGNPYYLRPTAKALRRGLAPWEEVLIRRNEPWTPYFTSRARGRGRRGSVARDLHRGATISLSHPQRFGCLPPRRGRRCLESAVAAGTPVSSAQRCDRRGRFPPCRRGAV